MLIEKQRIPLRDVLLFGLWPSFIKVALYRLRGYRIGKGVRIGLGSVLCAPFVEVGEYTHIGFLTVIRGSEIRIGPHVQIGSMTFLDTPFIRIGEGTKINEQVFVGGLQFPDSRFEVGRNCQIMQMTFINPCRSVVIGDDSGVGGDCLIFGHTSFLSQFEGYSVDFDHVTIGSSVSLAWRVFVLPGAIIGDGAVVGANSLVHREIPPRCMAVGFPARVVSKPPQFPRDLGKDEKTELFDGIVKEMVSFFEGSGLCCEQQGSDIEVTKPSTRWWKKAAPPARLRTTTQRVTQELLPSTPNEIDVFLSLQEISSAHRSHLQQLGVTWIEIARKEQSRNGCDLGDEVSLFLKRYGVRTLRADA